MVIPTLTTNHTLVGTRGDLYAQFDTFHRTGVHQAEQLQERSGHTLQHDGVQEKEHDRLSEHDINRVVGFQEGFHMDRNVNHVSITPPLRFVDETFLGDGI